MQLIERLWQMFCICCKHVWVLMKHRKLLFLPGWTLNTWCLLIKITWMAVQCLSSSFLAEVCIDFNPLMAGNVIHTSSQTEPPASTDRRCVRVQSSESRLSLSLRSNLFNNHDSLYSHVIKECCPWTPLSSVFTQVSLAIMADCTKFWLFFLPFIKLWNLRFVVGPFRYLLLKTKAF